MLHHSTHVGEELTRPNNREKARDTARESRREEVTTQLYMYRLCRLPHRRSLLLISISNYINYTIHSSRSRTIDKRKKLNVFGVSLTILNGAQTTRGGIFVSESASSVLCFGLNSNDLIRAGWPRRRSHKNVLRIQQC